MKKVITLFIGYLVLCLFIPLPNKYEIKSCKYAQDSLPEHIPDYLSIWMKAAILQKQLRHSSKKVVQCKKHPLPKVLAMRINPLLRLKSTAESSEMKALLKSLQKKKEIKQS